MPTHRPPSGGVARQMHAYSGKRRASPQPSTPRVPPGLLPDVRTRAQAPKLHLFFRQNRPSVRRSRGNNRRSGGGAGETGAAGAIRAEQTHFRRDDGRSTGGVEVGVTRGVLTVAAIAVFALISQQSVQGAVLASTHTHQGGVSGRKGGSLACPGCSQASRVQTEAKRAVVGALLERVLNKAPGARARAGKPVPLESAPGLDAHELPQGQTRRAESESAVKTGRRGREHTVNTR